MADVREGLEMGDRGATWPERLTAADDLRTALEFGSWDAVHASVRGSLYVLAGCQLREVAALVLELAQEVPGEFARRADCSRPPADGLRAGGPGGQGVREPAGRPAPGPGGGAGGPADAAAAGGAPGGSRPADAGRGLFDETD